MIRGPVLVTGAAGFVGANLVRALLDAGLETHVLVRARSSRWRLSDLGPRLHVHEADLTDRRSVAAIVGRVDPATVFHLAKHRGNPQTLDYTSAYAHNVLGTLHLLEAVRGRRLQRFVHAGSSLEYDLTRSPLHEDDPAPPLTVHGVTKRAATDLCRHFAVRHGVPAVVLRFFTVYGPWEDPARFVPRAIGCALGGAPLAITRAGLAHDWIHVGDVVDACLRAVDASGVVGEILNIATGRQTTNEAVLSIIEQVTGRRIVRQQETFPSRPWDGEHWLADVSKAQRLMGWSAATSVLDGISRTCQWFQDHATRLTTETV